MASCKGLEMANVYGPGRIEDIMPGEYVGVENILMAARVCRATALEVLQGDR